MHLARWTAAYHVGTGLKSLLIVYNCTEYTFGLVNVRYTSKQTSYYTSVYAISLAWPKDGQLILGAVSATAHTMVTMLGYGSIKWDSRGALGGILVHVPAMHLNEVPCYWAWVFKLEHVNAA